MNSKQRFLSSIVVGALTVALFVAGLILVGWKLDKIGFLVDAIIVGGLCGGLTYALRGGERYGLKLPGRMDNTEKLDPGFVGDVFVGLMAGCLGMGFGIWTKVLVGSFDVDHQPFVELVFVNFAIAYACGFLGLKLVKGISEQVFREEVMKLDNIEKRVEASEADTSYNKAEGLCDAGQFEVAHTYYRKTATLDPKGATRALIGMGRALRGQGMLGEAISVLDQAIGLREKEPEKHRIPVAYWNRACYRALIANNADVELDKILADLREAVRLQPAFVHDLTADRDLTGLQENHKFKQLLEECSMHSEKKAQ